MLPEHAAFNANKKHPGKHVLTVQIFTGSAQDMDDTFVESDSDATEHMLQPLFKFLVLVVLTNYWLRWSLTLVWQNGPDRFSRRFKKLSCPFPVTHWKIIISIWVWFSKPPYSMSLNKHWTKWPDLVGSIQYWRMRMRWAILFNLSFYLL